MLVYRSHNSHGARALIKLFICCLSRRGNISAGKEQSLSAEPFAILERVRTSFYIPRYGLRLEIYILTSSDSSIDISVEGNQDLTDITRFRMSIHRVGRHVGAFPGAKCVVPSRAMFA